MKMFVRLFLSPRSRHETNVCVQSLSLPADFQINLIRTFGMVFIVVSISSIMLHDIQNAPYTHTHNHTIHTHACVLWFRMQCEQSPLFCCRLHDAIVFARCFLISFKTERIADKMISYTLRLWACVWCVRTYRTDHDNLKSANDLRHKSRMSCAMPNKRPTHAHETQQEIIGFKPSLLFFSASWRIRLYVTGRALVTTDDPSQVTRNVWLWRKRCDNACVLLFCGSHTYTMLSGFEVLILSGRRSGRRRTYDNLTLYHMSFIWDALHE